jgi:integrase/recombinase XerD
MAKWKVDKLIEEAEKESRRDHLIIMLLFRTGIRVSELTNLKKKDIKENTIMIRGGKGDKDRSVPIEQELKTALGWHTDRLNNNDLLFDMTRQNVNRICKKYAAEVEEIEEIYPHKLRHSFAVHCLKNGMNVRELQKLLGHSDISTTMIYLDIIDKDIEESFKKVNW